MCDGLAVRKAKKMTPYHPQMCTECSVEVVDQIDGQLFHHILALEGFILKTTETAWELGLFYISLPSHGILFLEMKTVVCIFSNM